MQVDMPELVKLDRLDFIIRHSKDPDTLLKAKRLRDLMFIRMEQELHEDEED